MSENTRLPRTLIGACIAVFAAFAVLAALHLNEGHAPKAPEMDPRKPDALAPDRTAEFGGQLQRQVSMAKIDVVAEQQLGPKPEPLDLTALAQAHTHPGGESRIAAAMRIRELRKREGTAAALAALQALPDSNAN